MSLFSTIPVILYCLWGRYNLVTRSYPAEINTAQDGRAQDGPFVVPLIIKFTVLKILFC